MLQMSPQRKVNFLCDMRSVHCLFTGNEHYWTHERDDEGCALDFTVHVSGRFLLATCTRFLLKFWNALGLFVYVLGFFYLLLRRLNRGDNFTSARHWITTMDKTGSHQTLEQSHWTAFFLRLRPQWRSMPLVWRYIHRLSPQNLLYFKLFFW